MYVEKIMLEFTRNCDLLCEHCCRGEKEIVNMSLDTIDNIFAGIKHVHEIFLTGGEPLIAIIQLEYLAKLIAEGKISVDRVNFITNATVLSSRILKVLKTIKEHTRLYINLSSDIFHIFELERLGMLKKRDENIKILKDLFGLKIHTTTDPEEDKHMTRGLLASGRAKNISCERLEEINAMLPFNYVIRKNYASFVGGLKIDGENAIGTIYVDVNGFIVSGEYPEFKEGDEEALEFNANVNEMPFKDAVYRFYELYEVKKKARIDKLLGRK